MVKFPRFKKLTTEGYELYPGPDHNNYFDQRFDEGPWVVLGVNGIGKTTLLLLLKYCLAGPFRAREPGFAGEGAREFATIYKTLFGSRVENKARDATATLECAFGTDTLVVTRKLEDLSLVSATFSKSSDVDGIASESSFQSQLAISMGLDHFDDVLRILDLVVFKMDTQTDLIWRPEAQREVFKALLMPEASPKMREIEGCIVSADSSARNINAMLYKASKEVAREDARAKSQTSVRAQLASITAELDAAEDSLTKALDDVDEANESRLNARLYVKRANKDLEVATEAYEVVKLKTIQSVFTSLDQNTPYILSKILSDHQCPACGNDATDLAGQIQARQDENHCVICDSDKSESPQQKVVSISPRLQKRTFEAYEALKAPQDELKAHKATLEGAEVWWEQTTALVDEITSQIDRLNRQMLSLEKRLPKKDRISRRGKEKDIGVWRRDIDDLRKQRAAAEREYTEFATELREQVEKIKNKLERTFSRRAKPFFADQVRLVYDPRPERIGQMGKVFEFPAFEIEMDAGPGHGDFVRRMADQVSLSQREYLDVIFRMSLIEVIGGKRGGSFVFDGPEGSVDAVFGEHAGDLFANFANDTKRNLIIACNVVEGALIPASIRHFNPKRKKAARIVNLLNSARPTPALERLRVEYERKVNQILEYKL